MDKMNVFIGSNEFTGRLSANARNAFDILAENMDRDNLVFVSKTLKESLLTSIGIKEVMFSRIVKKLIDSKCIYKIANKEYMVNPYIYQWANDMDREALKAYQDGLCSRWNELQGSKN